MRVPRRLRRGRQQPRARLRVGCTPTRRSRSP